jgi:hypothetical protein
MGTETLTWSASNQEQRTFRIDAPTCKRLLIHGRPQQASDIGAEWRHAEHLFVCCAGMPINIHSPTNLVVYRPRAGCRESVRHSATAAKQVDHLNRCPAAGCFIVSSPWSHNASHHCLPQFKNLASKPSARGSFRTSHSQRTHTVHPKLLSLFIFSSSRLTFFSSFASHHSQRVWGSLDRPHPGWRCQKHPFTKIIFLCRGSTMSGFPGKLLSWRRNRNPIRWMIRRTLFSGEVSFALT